MRVQNVHQDSGTRYRAQGFTLIEIPVVISVIGLLMGISVPALSRARENAFESDAAKWMKIE